jgi:hypothetical protein
MAIGDLIKILQGYKGDKAQVFIVSLYNVDFDCLNQP